MGWSAFNPQGNTVAIAATTTASTAVQAQPAGGFGVANNYLVSNSGAAAFLAIGSNSAVLAAIPSTNPANGFYLIPGSSQTFTFSPNTWFSAITPTGTSEIYITPGDGL